MDTILTTLIIGISLSMDTFSLSIIYGTKGITKKNKILLSLIVGTYHFIMPLIGLYFGTIIEKYIIINLNILVSIIFLIISIQMIVSTFKDNEELKPLNLQGLLLFGFSVSIDSFSTGIGLHVINTNYIQSALIFALTSMTFTYLGLNFGNQLNIHFGKYSTLIWGIILLILSIYYFIK